MANDVSYFRVAGDSTVYSFNDADMESRVGGLETSVAAQNTRISTNEADISTNATNIQTNRTSIGTLSSLTTEAQGNLVAAVNEVDSHADANTTKIGSTTLPTTAQTLTGAIAEHENDITALNSKLEYGSFTTFSTFTLVNCTGTVSGSLDFKTSNSRWVYVSGRINIANYARTGGNPGFSFTLPTGIPTPTETTNIPVGINSLFPREQVNIRLTAGSRTARLTTTESYNNITGNVLTFVFTPAFFYVP